LRPLKIVAVRRADQSDTLLTLTAAHHVAFKVTAGACTMARGLGKIA
jgi:hypothetical protein